MSIGKKILGSVAVAGVVWAGMTAYIGSNTENYLKNYIENSNKIYANNGMKMSLLSFEKGFTASNAKVSVDFVDPKMKKELNQFLKLPMVMDYEIENGPLLFKDGVAFGASKINSKVNVNELLVNKDMLKKIVAKDIVLNTSMLVDFSNHAIYTGDSNEIIANIDGDVFTIAPFKLSGKMDLETFIGQIKMGTATIQGALENGGKVKVENLLLDADITKLFDNGLYLGDFVITANNVNIDNPAVPQKLTNATFKMAMNLDQNSQVKSTTELVNMNFGLNLKLGETKLAPEYDFVKEFSFDYGLDGIKMEALMAFQDTMKEVQEEQQAILTKLSSVKTSEDQMEVFKELEGIQQKLQNKMGLLVANFLVKDQTTLKFNGSLIDNANTTSNATFNIKYVGDEVLPQTLDEIEAKFKKELLNWIALNVKIDLDKSLVQKLPETTKQQLSMALMTGMLQENNTSYGFNANYVPRKLMVNGQDKSEMLQLVEMTMQGGM